MVVDSRDLQARIRDGDSTASLGNVFQCLTIFIVTKFLFYDLSLSCCNLCPLCLFLSPVDKHNS